jgi:hypothetical protein
MPRKKRGLAPIQSSNIHGPCEKVADENGNRLRGLVWSVAVRFGAGSLAAGQHWLMLTCLRGRSEIFNFERCISARKIALGFGFGRVSV